MFGQNKYDKYHATNGQDAEIRRLNEEDAAETAQRKAYWESQGYDMNAPAAPDSSPSSMTAGMKPAGMKPAGMTGGMRHGYDNNNKYRTSASRPIFFK